MSLYPKYGVYKILLEISGLKKSRYQRFALKPMSLNPKLTVYSLFVPRNEGISHCRNIPILRKNSYFVYYPFYSRVDQ